MKPVPIYFGDPSTPLFGWYHPAQGMRQQSGVVLCAPLGDEAIMTHRTYRTLAERLAGAGYVVLRFDYDGTGDSAGCDRDANRLASWLGSIGLAIEELRRRSGVGAACLFGIRFGGTLALLAASKRADVQGVAAWSVCASGKTYLRELRALRQMGVAAAVPVAGPRTVLEDGDEEAGGFLLSRATVADLLPLDLSALANPPAPKVLLLTRGGPSGGDERLAQSLRDRGVNHVSCTRVDGFTAMMDEPHRATAPAPLGDVLLEWLPGLTIPGPLSDRSAKDDRAESTLIRPTAESAPVREEPVLVDNGRLFGILSTPPEPAGRSPDVAVLLLNAGGVHHIGPNRMYVHLARTWASLGFSVLRLDVSSIGDSVWAGPIAGRMYSREAIADAAATIDWLRRERDLRHIVLVGLCSGAYVAFYASIENEGVIAQVLLNPETFFFKPGDSLDVRTLGRRSIARKANWTKLLRGEFQLAELSSALGRKQSALRSQLRTWLNDRLNPAQMPRLARAFGTILDRQTDTLLVYSSDDPGLPYLRAELGRHLQILRKRPGFRLEVIDGPDHTFSPLWAQASVSDLVTDYLVHLPPRRVR